MKNLRLLLLGTFIFAMSVSINLLGITVDEVREQKKDELINCYQEMIACLNLIEEENKRADNRSFSQAFKEGSAFGQAYPTNSIKESIALGNMYKNSIRLRQLKDLYASQTTKCGYIAGEIPAKLETQETENISE